jgi:type II secretory pathway predicted ATPase ExeA
MDPSPSEERGSRGEVIRTGHEESMSEEYLSYWGMSRPPFSLTPDPEMLYLSSQHSECLMRLKYAILSHKGGALLVSDTAGNGKTSLLGRLQNDLRDYYAGRVRVVFIDHPTLTPIEMLGEISRQLGGEFHTTEKIRSLNYLRDRLFTFYNDNIKVVVIVDEGQMLIERADILGELRILLNFCVSDAFLLTFIFSGQKPLDAILREMPEFWQRLPVRFFLRNLDFQDTKALIQYRLGKVGITGEIFAPDAFEGIYHYSEGCPRIICSVADLCLLIGYAKRARRIGFVEVSTACRDMESSGDSFHYFAYIKGQKEPDAPPKITPPKQEPASPRRRAPAKKAAQKLSPMPETLSIPCPNCFESNPPGAVFCEKCDAPLVRKCPSCGAKTDMLSDECPSCRLDIVRARAERILTLHGILRPFDVLEGTYDAWLKAAGVALDPKEAAIIVFPRGNIVTPGPAVQIASAKGEHRKEGCDFVFTDRRFMIVRPGNTVSVPLERIETCMVSDTGERIMRKAILVLGTKDEMFTVLFPSGSARTRAMLDSIASFALSVSLK